jgi:hypothetical protein
MSNNNKKTRAHNPQINTYFHKQIARERPAHFLAHFLLFCCIFCIVF